MVAARFSQTGALLASVTCFAPHLIDYTARALAVRPDGSVVIVGIARDRHASAAVPPTGPQVVYGLRATVTITGGTATTNGCGTYQSAGGLSLGSSGVTIDGVGHDGSAPDATRGGRFYEGVALAGTGYVVASTNGPDANVAAGNAAWIQRFTAAGNLDATFNPTGAGSIVPVPGRVVVPNYNFHAIKIAADGGALVAGESMDAAAATNRVMALARVSAVGALGTIGRSRVAGGNNTGQAMVLQPNGSVIVGGSANLAGRAAFGLTRFTAAAARDNTFGTAGQTATPIGTPAMNAYITGMALNPAGNMLSVSGRATDPLNPGAGLFVTTGRYFATGAPPPPAPLPAAATNGIDSITSSSARVTGMVNANGTASNWWIEYGTTLGYGATTAPQAVATLNDDADVAGMITGLAAGTLYHARIVVSSAAGTDPGDDLVFTTLGTPAPVVPATPVTGGGATATGGSKATTTPAKAKKKAKKQCVVPKVTGKKLNKARTTVYAKGCKVQVKYLKSKKAKNTVLSQSRKAGKKLGFRAVVKLTVASKTAPKKK